MADRRGDDSEERTRRDEEEERRVQAQADAGVQVDLQDLIEDVRRLRVDEAADDGDDGQGLQQNEHPDPANLRARDLLRLIQSARILLEDGRVFVTLNDLHGRVSLEGDRLFVHCLQNQDPPPNAAILPIDEIVPLLPPCMVFLDLQWPDNMGRVVITLFPDASLSQQFLLLCTGMDGHSYANTQLLGVHKKGFNGERVNGGDYDQNNGDGGAALLPNLGRENTNNPHQAGDVCARTIRGALSAQFAIMTRSLPRAATNGAVFGRVEEGLEVVQNAANYHHVRDITVVDCGVVIIPA